MRATEVKQVVDELGYGGLLEVDVKLETVTDYFHLPHVQLQTQLQSRKKENPHSQRSSKTKKITGATITVTQKLLNRIATELPNGRLFSSDSNP